MPNLVAVAAGHGRDKGSVVFIHGLGGHVFTTWGGKSSSSAQFWPGWMAEELTEIAVYSLGYEAEPSELTGSAMSLLDRGQNTLALLLVPSRLWLEYREGRPPANFRVARQAARSMG